MSNPYGGQSRGELGDWLASSRGEQQPPPQQQQPYQPPPGGWPPQPPPQAYRPPPRQRHTGRTILITVACFFAAVIVLGVIGGALSAKHNHGGTPAATASTPPASHAASTAAKASAAQTVTYQVTGTPGAQVTYGPAGSSITGTVPMNLTRPLGSPVYYSVTAQLNGGGAVACKLLVDGKVISQASATGGYNIASCEIVQNFNGGWQDGN
jgi:nitrogen fixation protein FixH